MALIKCTECEKEISEKAEKCPNCGAPNKVLEQKKDLSVGQYLLLFLVVAILFGLHSVGKGESKGVVMTDDGIRTVYSNDFEILYEETTVEKEKDTFKIKGKIKQNLNESYTGIMITINLLGEDGEKIRETDGIQYSKYLGNNIWEFEVYGEDPDGIVKSYELDSCYGY